MNIALTAHAGTEMWRTGRWLVVFLAALSLALVAAPASGATTPRGALQDVVAIGPDDAWAVGRDHLFHWNGAGWTDVPWATELGPRYAAVGASSPTDVWAVGRVTRYDQWRPLVVRWNGTRWVHQRMPSFRGEVSLTDVAVRGPDDVWAVGRREVSLADPAPSTLLRSVVLRWDGVAWTKVVSPPDVRFEGVVRVGAAQLWVVGARVGGEPVALRRRADGGWRTYPVPVQAGSRCRLTDLDASRGAGAVVGWCTDRRGRTVPYAASFDVDGLVAQEARGRGQIHAVDVAPAAFAVGADRGDAAVWRRNMDGVWWKVAFPAPVRGTSALLGVSVRRSSDAWAVGRRAQHGAIRPMAAHRGGAGWELVPV